MTDTLNWAVVGCGDVVFKKSGPSIVAADRSRIVAVMRRNPEAAQPFADEHGIAIRTDDAAAVIEHPHVHIVYVATPPSTHLQYVEQVAAAGKHVLVEKPMGLTAAEDQRMIDACDAAGVQLFVAYYRRFHPHVQAMKRMIEAGKIGRPLLAQIDFEQPMPADGDIGWRGDPQVSGGGLAADVVAHRLDLLDYLFGPPVDIAGHSTRSTRNLAVEGAAVASVRSESGTLWSVRGAFDGARHLDRFRIVGTEGEIDANPLDGHAFTTRIGDDVQQHRSEKDPAPHLGLIRHIEQVLAGRTENAASGRAGMQTDRVLDVMLGRV